MNRLKTIGIAHDKEWPAAKFWERYDKGGAQRVAWRVQVCGLGVLFARQQVRSEGWPQKHLHYRNGEMS